MATAAVAAVGSGRPACSRRPAPRRPTSKGITAPRQHATSVQRPCGRSRAKGEGEQWTELGVHQEDDWDEDEDVGSDDDVGADPEAHQRLLASQDAGCAATAATLPAACHCCLRMVASAAAAVQPPSYIVL